MSLKYAASTLAVYFNINRSWRHCTNGGNNHDGKRVDGPGMLDHVSVPRLKGTLISVNY